MIIYLRTKSLFVGQHICAYTVNCIGHFIFRNMSCIESTRFEDLSVELIIEILEYFSANEIYFSFSQLNIRFNSMIKSFPHLSITINERTDPSIYCFFSSLESIYVGFRYSSKTKNMCRSRTYVKYYCRWYKRCRISNYAFYYKPNPDIEQLFVQQKPKYSRLRSMILFYVTSKLTESIFNGEYPNLQICHIDKCTITMSRSIDYRR